VPTVAGALTYPMPTGCTAPGTRPASADEHRDSDADEHGQQYGQGGDIGQRLHSRPLPVVVRDAARPEG
jgi:hypothetical protein